MAKTPSEPRSDSDKSVSDEDQARQWFAMAGIGTEFIVAVLLFGGLGWFLDGRWSTSPWLLLTGMAIGFAGGLYNMVKMARKNFRG